MNESDEREPADYRQQQEQDEYQKWLNDPCEQKEYFKWLDCLNMQNQNGEMK